MIKFKIIEITVLCFLALSVNAQAGNLKIPETILQRLSKMPQHINIMYFIEMARLFPDPLK